MMLQCGLNSVILSTLSEWEEGGEKKAPDELIRITATTVTDLDRSNNRIELSNIESVLLLELLSADRKNVSRH